MFELLKKLFGCDEPEEWEEEAQPNLEVGCASELAGARKVRLLTYRVTEKRIDDLEEYNCPRCRRFLFSADKASAGFIYTECTKCKMPISFELKDERHKAGFV